MSRGDILTLSDFGCKYCKILDANINIQLLNVHSNPNATFFEVFFTRKRERQIGRHGGTGIRRAKALADHQIAWELDKYAF